MNANAAHPDAPALIDDLQAVIWEADPNTFQFEYVSRGAETLLGYPVDHWLSQPTFWVDLLHPDDRAQAIQECLTAIEYCRDHDFEYRVRTRDGEIRWLRDIVSVICRDGRPVTLRGLMVDVTPRKTREAARSHEDRYCSIALEHSLDIVTIIDRTGVIRYSSPSVERVLGYSPRERAGKNLFDLVHPDDLSRARMTIDTAFLTGNAPPLISVRYRHADGTWRVLEATGQRFDDAGAVLGVVNARDVTERVHLEEQFRHTQKMDALGRLTGSVAHDFNNLLTAIAGNADMAIESDASFGVRLELLEIKKATELAAALTRQLLAFSRRQQAALVAVDVHAALEGIRRMLERVLGKSIAIEFSLGAADSYVKLGPGLLEQVVLNLAINARDAMPSGGRLVLATSNVTLAEVQNGAPTGRMEEYLALRIDDNGVGMTPEIRARIFEPYFTTKAPTKGTGLGLPTVYGIIQEAHGRIEVDTDVGKGTAFIIFLPLIG
jgi:two-component system cell cycle sensor histidine kinase/response regulator CckA